MGTIELQDSRRLTGPRLVSDSPGAVIDGRLEVVDTMRFRDAWRARMAAITIKFTRTRGPFRSGTVEFQRNGGLPRKPQFTMAWMYQYVDLRLREAWSLRELRTRFY